MKTLEKGVQDIIKNIGTDGCYALCLVKIAGLFEKTDYTAGQAADLIIGGAEMGFIGGDMTVRNGAGFLQYITGNRWAMRRSSVAPAQNAPLSATVAEWFNPRTGLTHFTLISPAAFDPLADSVTVKEGAVRSYRVYMLV
jgi:hypothetical protein